MYFSSFFDRSELTRALWAFRREFLVVGFFSMLVNVLLLAPTLYMLQIYDRVMVSRSELTLVAMSLITLFLFGVMASAEWFRSKILVHAGLRLDGLLGTRVFNASFEAQLLQGNSGPTRAFGDLINVRQFLTGNGIFAFFDTPWAPIYLAVLFFLHPTLGFVAIGFALVQAGLAWFSNRSATQAAEQASKASADAINFVQGKLRNAEVLESMGMISMLTPQWLTTHRKALALQSQSHSVSHRLAAFSKFIRYSQQSLALGVGALLVIDGQLSPGAMIAANVLMSRALAPIDMLVGIWRSFVGARSAFQRLEKLLAEYPERDLALKRTEPEGVIELRDCVAGAQGRPTPILHNVSVRMNPGEVTAVVGPSGSGKSTLARCLVGIWPLASGEALLDGRPISGWDRTELGPYLGYLPQDIELFEGTIAENIARMGEVESELVIAAARASGLHEMILRFPKGYDTPIGEASGMLSGGQRQRIGLARAIYGHPKVLVLDEPNANLDDAGEAALVRTVQEMKRLGTAVILITHRPGILAVADQLVVLRDGKVVEAGPTAEVLSHLQDAKRRPPAGE